MKYIKHFTVCQEICLLQKIQWGIVHKTTLRFDNSLVGLENSLQAVILTVTVYYS